MRGLGYALIIFGVITAVLIFLYAPYVGWSGLTGSITAILAGIGFTALAGTECRDHHHCECNRY